MKLAHPSFSERMAAALPSVPTRRKEIRRPLPPQPQARPEERLVLFCDRAIERGLLFLIIFTPLAFGTVHLWSITAMELVVALLVVLWMIKMVALQRLRQESGSVYERLTESQVRLPTGALGFVKTPLNLPILLFIVLVLVQMAPLPPAVLQSTSSGTYELYQKTLPHPWPASAMQASSWRSLSVYAGATKGELLKLLSYAAVFFLVVNNLRTKRQLGRLAKTVIGVGFAISLLGILQSLSGTTKIYWFRDASYASPFGPYVNRNHFAGYVGLALGLALGYLMTLERRPIGRGLFGQVGDKTPPSAEEIGPKRVLLGFVITIMTAALFLSLSRGGVISVMLALAFFTFLLGMRRTQRRKRRAVPVILSLVLVFLVWMGIDPVLHRLSTLLEPSAVEDARPVLWQDTLGLIGHFPLVGTGLGTFRHVYPRYKTVPSQRLYTHAHNDYVELASEAGLAGFFLVVGALGFGLAWSTRRWFQRRDPYAVGLALGGLTAVAAFLIHDAVDFNFHIPANALTVSAVVGLLVSAVHLKSRGGSGESPPVSPASALGRLCCPGVLVVSVLAAAAVTATWAADGYLRRGVKTRSLEDMRRAAALEPWSAEPRYWTGKLWEQRGLETTSHQEQAKAFGRVRRAYEEALTLAPTEAKYHLSLAWSLHRLASLNDQKRRISPSRALMERAYHHYRLARELDPSNRFIGDYVSRSAPATLR